MVETIFAHFSVQASGHSFHEQVDSMFAPQFEFAKHHTADLVLFVWFGALWFIEDLSRRWLNNAISEIH
jgi:hypothetical protein